jgi:hypothetical protein
MADELTNSMANIETLREFGEQIPEPSSRTDEIEVVTAA